MQTKSLITGMSNTTGSGKDDEQMPHSRDRVSDKLKKTTHEFLNLSAEHPIQFVR